jgi:hypothetical protein
MAFTLKYPNWLDAERPPGPQAASYQFSGNGAISLFSLGRACVQG